MGLPTASDPLIKMGSLCANRCVESVPGQHQSVIGKNEHSLGYGFDDGVKVATFK
jgi:hypothetical protein